MIYYYSVICSKYYLHLPPLVGAKPIKLKNSISQMVRSSVLWIGVGIVLLDAHINAMDTLHAFVYATGRVALCIA